MELDKEGGGGWREREGKKVRERGGGAREKKCSLHVQNVHVFRSRFHTASVMKEPWEDKVKRIQATSPYGHVPNWSILLMTVDL